MMPRMLAIVFAFVVAPASPQRAVERDVVVSITEAELRGGVVTEITWDGGVLVLQGVFVAPGGELKADYLVVPAEGVELRHLTVQPQASLEYWSLKSSRLSPTGLGRIESTSDSKLPMYGVGTLEQRVRDAQDMGGVQTRHLLRLGSTVLHDRTAEVPPYDGETYSWSPAELNRLAYVDGKGDLWVAMADGSRPKRLLRGDFTLPAWSTDGRAVAVGERKEGGKRWDIVLVHLPEEFRQPAR